VPFPAANANDPRIAGRRSTPPAELPVTESRQDYNAERAARNGQLQTSSVRCLRSEVIASYRHQCVAFGSGLELPFQRPGPSHLGAPAEDGARRVGSRTGGPPPMEARAAVRRAWGLPAPTGNA
jgi:hypothetical protein